MARSRKELMSAMDRYREQYNPLRGLTIARSVALLEGAQRGQFADLQWTYEFVEQTDADLLALVERRTSALCEMDWNIKQVSEDFRAYDDKLAEEQADALRLAYEGIDNLYQAIAHFEMAAFRGFAHVAPHTSQGGAITHLECLDQWNFTRDGRYGPWYWNPAAKDVPHTSLDPSARLDPSEYIVAESRRPVDRLGLLKFVRANLSEKDWDSYIEIYGVPSVMVIMPETVPDGKESEYQTAAEAVAEGGSGALPHGADAKFPSEVRGVQPFEKRLEWLSKKLILSGTGGMLTMLAESGSGTLAGGAHAETFRTIARMRAQAISEILQHAIDRRVLDAAFEGKPRLAYFDIAAEEERDVGDIVDHAVKIHTAFAGQYMMDPEDLAERTGYKIVPVNAAADPDGDEQPPMNRATVRNREDDSLQAARRRRADAVSDDLNEELVALAAAAEYRDLRPLATRLYEAMELPYAEMVEALISLREDLLDLAIEIMAYPELAGVLEGGMSAAAVNGYAEGAAERKESDESI